MLDTIMHPRLRERRQGIESARNKQYVIFREQATKDLEKMVELLAVIRDKTENDFVSIYLELAKSLHGYIQSMPPYAALPEFFLTALNLLENEMLAIANFSQKSEYGIGAVGREFHRREVARSLQC